MSDDEKPANRQATSSRVWRETALTAGALAGLICIAATVAALFFGIKPLVFRSGSMSPEITTGSLALSRTVPATDLKVGNVISVENAQGIRITHRVYEIQSQAGNAMLVTLKGDANKDPDIEPYTITEADRVFTSVGGLGYVVAWLSSPTAIFLGGAFVGALMVIVIRPPSRRNDDSEDSGTHSQFPTGKKESQAVSNESPPVVESTVESEFRTRRFPFPSGRSILALSAAALSIVGLTQATWTAAAFTDSAVATSGPLAVSSDVLPRIASTSCSQTTTGNGQDTHITWKHLGPAFKYKVDIWSNSDGNVYKTKPVDPGAGAAAGTDVTVTVNEDDTYYTFGSTRRFVARVYTVNRVSGEQSVSWRGHQVKRIAATWSVECDGAIPNAATGGEFPETANARMTAPSDTPSTAATTTTPAPTTTTTTTTTTTATTTPPSTTTTTAPSTTTTTTTADTTLGAAAKSTSNGYSAALVKSSESSQTALVISDANGEELKRISATVSTQYKWDSSTDTLWIVDGGQLYKASGSTWSKTSVDPTSSDVPADIAALVE